LDIPLPDPYGGVPDGSGLVAPPSTGSNPPFANPPVYNTEEPAI